MRKHKNKGQTDTHEAIRVHKLETDTTMNAPALEDRIRQRAYKLHQARGGAPGKDLDDWLQAEREIKAEKDQASDAQA